MSQKTALVLFIHTLNKSVTGVGTILASFLPLVECMLEFQMLGSAPRVSLRSQLMKASTPILLSLSAVVEQLPVSDLV
jgi:hypothetical protein